MGVRVKSKLAISHPCVFSDPYVRSQVDPEIKRVWAETFNTSAPFGELRRLWRTNHCSVLNPYESEFCPYTHRQCADAFMLTAVRSARRARNPRGAMGYFRKITTSFAFDRADNKPLRRDETQPDPAQAQEGPGLLSNTHGGDPARRGTDQDSAGSVIPTDTMRRLTLHIGSVLRTFDFRPRPRPTDDGETGTK